MKLAGQVPWSPALQRAGMSYRYWGLRLREYTSAQVNMDELKKLSIQLKLSSAECGPHSNKSIRQQIRKSKRALTAAKAKAQKLRDVHMHERATFFAVKHGMSAKAACNAIAARERSSRQFSRDDRRVVSSLHPNMGSWVQIAAKCIKSSQPIKNVREA